MNLTVTARVIGALAIIVVIGVVAKLITYRSLQEVEESARRLSEVEVRLSAAAYEMEINTNGLGLAVMKYLQTRDPQYREWAARDADDFNRFLAAYSSLIRSSVERRLAAELDSLRREYTGLGSTLLKVSDEQETSYDRLAQEIETIDELIETRWQPLIARRPSGDPLAAILLRSALTLEAEIAEVGFLLANYRRQNAQRTEKLLEKKALVAERILRGVERDRRLSRQDTAIVRELRQKFDQVRQLTDRVRQVDQQLLAMRDQFLRLRDRIDAMLDRDIQPMAQAALDGPRRDAKLAAEKALRSLTMLLLVYLLSALLIGVWLRHSIVQPLLALRTGAQVVGRGDLEYRLPAPGIDEFNQLAQEFNRMVARLQETTVARSLLQESEKRLSESVQKLQHEIAERERAEANQASLQSALRRSETMSAMGNLVAGVAHEVRNPLFAMSSTLDALDERLGETEQLHRFTAVLRGEVQRLTKLMADLLDYGRPRPGRVAPGKVRPLIEDAMERCRPPGDSPPVAVVADIPADLPELPIDAERLTLVFRNLLENAIQHSPPGAAVHIGARVEEDGMLACIVQDAGRGFAEDDLPHLFEPFFTRRRGGTGLGLSIVARIVEDHRGSVRAENRAEGGAQVVVRLPLAA